MAPWRSGYAAVCKTAYTGSNPVGASNFIFVWLRHPKQAREKEQPEFGFIPNPAR